MNREGVLTNALDPDGYFVKGIADQHLNYLFVLLKGKLPRQERVVAQEMSNLRTSLSKAKSRNRP